MQLLLRQQRETRSQAEGQLYLYSCILGLLCYLLFVICLIVNELLSLEERSDAGEGKRNRRAREQCAGRCVDAAAKVKFTAELTAREE